MPGFFICIVFAYIIIAYVIRPNKRGTLKRTFIFIGILLVIFYLLAVTGSAMMRAKIRIHEEVFIRQAIHLVKEYKKDNGSYPDNLAALSIYKKESSWVDLMLSENWKYNYRKPLSEDPNEIVFWSCEPVNYYLLWIPWKKAYIRSIGHIDDKVDFIPEQKFEAERSKWGL